VKGGLKATLTDRPNTWRTLAGDQLVKIEASDLIAKEVKQPA
jgi:hypothetical protein